MIREGGPWLRQNKPAFFKAAMANNDARELYEACLAMVPKFQDKVAAAKNKSLLEKLTQGDIPKGSAPDSNASLQDMLEMDDEQMDQELGVAEGFA